MKTKVYSYSSSSSYSNLNGKERFESIEVENDNGKVRSKYTKTKDGITTTKYCGDVLTANKRRQIKRSKRLNTSK